MLPHATHIIYFLRQICDRRLAKVVRRLAHQRVEKVCATKSARHKWRSRTIWGVDHHCSRSQQRPCYFAARLRLPSITDVTKYFFMAHLPERNLAPVTVGQKVLERVQSSSQKAVGLPELGAF